ncbi:MAG: hypothetical protein UW18_C0019G0003 [Microgenomates group bacterium GW2011_GWF1_44_10]|nr:MAG: hypothetical protein UW18_C0019G0003 [Microgenomates group bacterium GW2011_GWF1_44_10]
MATEIYIGTERADFSGDVGVVFSGGDIRDITEGRVNSSYEITLPLTAQNKKLLKYSDHLNVFSEVTDRGLIICDGTIVLQGKVIVLSYDNNSASLIIQGTSWYDHFKDTRLRDLDLSAEDHLYTQANIEASWAGSAAFYRYPMINFGQLFSQETGSTANWRANDFIPMFRIVDILEAIFYPFTLAGGWLTEAAEKYVLGKETIATGDYKNLKAVDARVQTASDNQVSSVVPSGSGSTVITFTEAKLILNDVITNEGSNFYSGAAARYLVPETGTYNFAFDARPYWSTFVGLTINAQTLTLKIVRDRGGSLVNLASQTWTYTSTDILLGVTYTIDTGHVHLEDGDYVYVTGYMVNDLANSGVDRTVIMNFIVATTRLYAVPDDRWRYTGLNKLIEADKWLPDVTCMEFIRGVKEAYNLRFTPDLFRQIVYIESTDKTYTTNERTLTGIDHADINVENVAENYASNIRLKFITDKADKAIDDVANNVGEQYYKDIALSSVYAKKEIEEYVNSLFAWTVKGPMYQILLYTTDILRIWGAQEFLTNSYYPAFRASEFKPRLLTWNGLTSGFTWYLAGTSKTTYPQATSEDMATVYSTNYLTTFHLIDTGKIIKIEAAADKRMMQEFVTVVNDVTEEGFRAMYKFAINGEYFYGYLNRIEFNGVKMRLELIIKH